MTSQVVTTPTWTTPALEDLVVELLANLESVEVGEMKRRLQEKGGSLPVDSLDLLDVLQEFRQRTGLRLPVKKLRSDTMRSVKGFAQFAAEEATQG